MSPDPRDPRDPRNYPDRDPVVPVDPPIRERIERRTIIRETPRSGGGGAAFGAGALIVLLLVAVGAFLWWNSRHNGVGFGANPASTTGSTTTTSPFGSSSTGAGAIDNPMAEGTGPFGIAVGNYADEQGAVNERQRLTTLTSEPISMSQTSENGNTVYRVVIGNFATQAQADSAGRSLASTASLPDWKVVPIQQ